MIQDCRDDVFLAWDMGVGRTRRPKALRPSRRRNSGQRPSSRPAAQQGRGRRGKGAPSPTPRRRRSTNGSGNMNMPASNHTSVPRHQDPPGLI
jgi:hypothetical protein